MSAVVKFEQAITFEVYQCCECGMSFGLDADFVKRRRDDRGWWHCPRGHRQHFLGESEAQRLRGLLAEANAATTQQAERAMLAEREVATKTRLLKRLRNGVCPCCKRPFVALANHMKTKHPEYKP